MRKGWYKIDGVQDGDRTLDQQIKGIEHLVFTGKSVLELGCAEGLMSRWMLDRGAHLVHGVDVVAEHIKEARSQCWGRRASFQVLDLNDISKVWVGYDIVMALAVFHKLKRPDLAAAQFAHIARETIVVRLPPENAPLVIDARSGNVAYNVEQPIVARGFRREHVTEGSFNEWTATYVR